VKIHPYDVSYLTNDSIQEGVGSSQITPLLLGLVKRGLRVSLLSFEKISPSVELKDFLTNHNVDWYPHHFGRLGPLGGIERFNLIRRDAPTSLIYHARSDLPAAAVSQKHSETPILWDVRSLWSDQRSIIDSQGWNPIASRGARLLENLAAKNATGLNTLTYAVVPILEKRHRQLPQHRSVIPTCVDLDRFRVTPLPRGPITCLLSGTFNNYYDLEKTRDFISFLRTKMDLRVVWARGHESTRNMLGVGEDISVISSYSEMPSLVAQSHFGIAICKDTHLESLAAAVPTKIAEFLASGRPMVISKGIGDLDYLFSDGDIGVVIDSAKDFPSATNRLMNLLNDVNTSEKCNLAARENFDLNKAIDQYVSLYGKLFKKPC